MSTECNASSNDNHCKCNGVLQEPDNDAIHDDGQFTSQLCCNRVLRSINDQPVVQFGDKKQAQQPLLTTVDLVELMKKMVSPCAQCCLLFASIPYYREIKCIQRADERNQVRFRY